MVIRVARGVVSRMREFRDGFVLQVQDASDVPAAAQALGRARGDIVALDGGQASMPDIGPQDRNGPKYVSPVMPAGAGPFIEVDAGYTPWRLVRTIPDLVVARLEQAGVSDAVIAAPRGGPLSDWSAFASTPRAVVARLYPPPPPVQRFQRTRGQIPEAWLEEAVGWLAPAVGDHGQVWASMAGVDFPVAFEQIGGSLAQWRAARTSVYVVAGDQQARVRVVNGKFSGFEPCVVLGGGGPAASDDELLALFDRLVEVVDRHAGELAHAFVTIEPTFSGLITSWPPATWRGHGGESPELVDQLVDELVFEAFPYQILGPGHLRRLGGAPPGAGPLDGGRMGVAVGEPADWLLPAEAHELDVGPWGEMGPRRRDPSVQDRAREELAPCLPRQGEGRQLLQQRAAPSG